MHPHYRAITVLFAILQELGDAATLLQEGSVVGAVERRQRLRWEERLRVTQSSLVVQVDTLLKVQRIGCDLG